MEEVDEEEVKEEKEEEGRRRRRRRNNGRRAKALQTDTLSYIVASSRLKTAPFNETNVVSMNR